MYRIVFGGTDRRDHSGTDGSSGTPASERHQTDGKASAARFRVDSGISELEWQGIPVGSGALGSPAPARRGLGSTDLESARKWMDVSQGILAVICGFRLTGDQPRPGLVYLSQISQLARQQIGTFC